MINCFSSTKIKGCHNLNVFINLGPLTLVHFSLVHVNVLQLASVVCAFSKRRFMHKDHLILLNI